MSSCVLLVAMLRSKLETTCPLRTYKCNVEARSCNHCCSGKAISITHSECAFVALGIQYAKAYAPYCSAIRGRLFGFTVFFSTLSQTARVSGGKTVEHKICVLMVSATFV
jgi:hypothetical protein